MLFRSIASLWGPLACAQYKSSYCAAVCEYRDGKEIGQILKSKRVTECVKLCVGEQRKLTMNLATYMYMVLVVL